jgi:hypothetical protein
MTTAKPKEDYKQHYEEALESRAQMQIRENEANERAVAWEAAYWALVKAIKR